MFSASLKKGTLWTLIFFLVSLAKTLLLTPMMLRYWGAANFGLWAIVLSLRAILLFLSDGFLRYVVNRYNLLFHQRSFKASLLLRSGMIFNLMFSVLLCLVFGLVLFSVPSFRILLFGATSIPYFAWALWAYIFAAVVQNAQRMYAATQEARGLVWVNVLVEVLLLLAELFLLSFLLYSGSGFAQVLFVDALLIAFVALVYLRCMMQRYPMPLLSWRKSMVQGYSYFKKAIQLFAGNFFEKLTSDGLVLLLSIFRFDKTSIALFATVRTIVNTPLLAHNLLLNTYTPQLQKDFATRHQSGLNALFRLVRLRIGPVLLLGILCCVPLYEPVFLFWTKGKIPYQHSFMMMMMVVAVFQLYAVSFTFVFKGLNILPQMLGLMLLKTVLMLLCFYWSQGQILDLAMGLMLIELCLAIFFMPLLLGRYWRQQGLSFSYVAVLASAAPYVLTALILLYFAVQSMLHLL